MNILVHLLTVDVESGAVVGSSSSVAGNTCVQASILHYGPADVDMGDDLSMHSHILTHHIPETRQVRTDWSGIVQLWLQLVELHRVKLKRGNS